MAKKGTQVEADCCVQASEHVRTQQKGNDSRVAMRQCVRRCPKQRDTKHSQRCFSLIRTFRRPCVSTIAYCWVQASVHSYVTMEVHHGHGVAARNAQSFRSRVFAKNYQLTHHYGDFPVQFYGKNIFYCIIYRLVYQIRNVPFIIMRISFI